MQPGNGLWRLWVLATIAACAAPSRRLTPRQIEDPITLPRGMASASLSVEPAHYWPTGANALYGVPAFRFGITDRLQLGLLSLGYAFLDDSPAGATPAAPFSLALQGGVLGLGYSSIDGTIVFPILALRTAKHLDSRWRFDAGASWVGNWASGSSVAPAFNPGTLAYSGRPSSLIDGDASATRQVADRIAVTVRGYIGETRGCLSTLCGWRNRTVQGSISLSLRPWHWMTVGISASVGLRRRSPSFMPPPDPDDPPAVLPNPVLWLAGGGWATFYW